VPKEFIREQKILNSNLKHTVPTEFGDSDNSNEDGQVEAEPIGLPSEKPFVPTSLPGVAEEDTGQCP